MHFDLPLIGPIHFEQLLFELVLTLAVAVLFGLLLRRLGHSPVIGYLLAGVVLGPGVTGAVSDVESLTIMGETGIALLLFAIGLELPWHRLQKIGRVAAVGGVLQLTLSIAAAVPLLMLVGLSWRAAVVGGMAFALSSTAVVLRILQDRSELDSVHGRVALAVLLAQDLATVVFLMLIPVLASGDSSVATVSFDVFKAMFEIVLLAVAILLADRLLLRRFFHHAAAAVDRELLIIMSMVVSLGAIGAAEAMGISPAIGGFIAGLIIGDAPYADRIRAEIAPVRTALVAIFFAWIGMLADPLWMLDHIVGVAAIVAAVVILKPVLTWSALRISGVPMGPAVIAGVALGQLGEFSFAVVFAAETEGLLPANGLDYAVSATLVTLLLTPFMLRGGRRVERLIRSAPMDVVEEGDDDPDLGRHVIVIGLGPSGREVVTRICQAGGTVVGIDLSHRLVDPPAGLRRVVFGDAGHAETLQAAGIKTASAVAVVVSDPQVMREIVSRIRSRDRDVPIVVRSRYHRFASQVSGLGATVVIDEEVRTGNAIAREVVDITGLT